MHLETHDLCLQLAYWTQFNHAEMPLLEALEILNSLIDESDPDVSEQFYLFF